MMRLAPAAKFLAFARTSSSFRLTNDAQRLVCVRMMSAAAAPGPKVCVCMFFFGHVSSFDTLCVCICTMNWRRRWLYIRQHKCVRVWRFRKDCFYPKEKMSC